jgi:hypothetical protein
MTTDIRLQAAGVDIIGNNILLDGSLLLSKTRSLWLDKDTLLISWDLNRANFLTTGEGIKPYEAGKLIEIEGKVEVSDVILVEFELVPGGPVIPGDVEDILEELHKRDDDLTAPELEVDPGGNSDIDGSSSSHRGEDALSRGEESLGSIFDAERPDTIVKRRLSLADTLKNFAAQLESLSSRVVELEQRVGELEGS